MLLDFGNRFKNMKSEKNIKGQRTEEAATITFRWTPVQFWTVQRELTASNRQCHPYALVALLTV